MRLILYGILLCSLGINLGWTQEEVVSFKNVREGKSYYEGGAKDRAVKKVLKVISRDEVTHIYKESLVKLDKKNLCSYELNADINKTLDARGLEIDLKGFIYVLRDNNEIDDVVAKILLSAHEVKSTELRALDQENLPSVTQNDKTKSQLELIASFEKRFNKACFDEGYRSLYGELLKIDKKTKSQDILALNYQALKENRITAETYKALEQGRINELEQGSLTLSSYNQKIKTLRLQYPLREIKERSNFTSVEVKKIKASRRQKLFESYTDLQIIMMGNVIKKLRARLEYDLVEINGYRNGELQETIPLDPMERFRFAIKALRKEMSLLSLNTYFAGRTPDYIDLMVASYEVGIIPATELEAVASLEEIWNPKKTFWDKASVWVKMFSSIATIVIPPPYGFIPALVIVVIEATVGKKSDPNQNDPSVLF
jgi:hypothetical protein